MKKKEALALVKGADVIRSVKGSKVVSLGLKSSPPDEEVLGLLLGPTGNLRAPALRVGRELIVGFEPGLYAEALR